MLAPVVSTAMGGGEIKTVAPTKFTWTIRDFSKSLGKKRYSRGFIAGDCYWRLAVHRTGRKSWAYLSMYIEVAGPITLTQGWLIDAAICIAVINPYHKSKTVKKGTRHAFKSETRVWGFPQFIRLVTINDPAEGYIINDAITCEALVLVHSKEPAVKAPLIQTPLTVKNNTVKVAAPVVPDTPVTIEPLNHTKEARGTTALTTDQEGHMPVTDDRMKILSKGDDDAHVRSVSKRLLTELSSRRKKQKSISSNEFSDSKPEATTNIHQQQKEELRKFLNMSLEAIQQANCFGTIEAILDELVQHTTNLQEKATLEDIISRLANLKRSVEDAKAIEANAQARRPLLVGKTAELDSKLEQRQNEISSLESELSTLSEEEAKLQAEIDRVIAQKKSVSVKLDRVNKETCKEMEEWTSLGEEKSRVNEEWIGAKEKMALANVRWDLIREDLGL